ncbi:MAG: beta-mannanase [Chloroflexota bacterium]|nr:beta-mannanase [Chloroflexota bacterium]
MYASSWLSDLSAITSVENATQKPASIVMWYQGWGAGKGEDFQTSWMDNVRNHGAIPLVTWEPWNYKQTQKSAWSGYSLKDILNGTYDAYITKWAQDSKAWGHPFFLRFAAEMNGYWFPWSEGVNGNTKGQFVQAWKHVHDIFTAQGATNVSWLWCPNVEWSHSIPLRELYPGNDYVDWIGMDGYNWSTVYGHKWQTFSQIFQYTYNDILSMGTHKPLMIAETASAERGHDKAGWITDAFLNVLPKAFPEIKAFVWFNENKETDWRIQSSASARAAFAKAVSSPIYASNQYASLDTSPIPTPANSNAAKR